MLKEVETICRAIPHRDLCIQWDICIEMILWDGRSTHIRNPFANLHAAIIQRMQSLSRAVPKDVELGFHLCYGDWEAKHFIEPEDAGKLVEMANTLAEHVDRPITYFHVPVPANRSDDSYFKPLTALQLSSKTELYLGLVHADGVENTRKRISVASIYVSDFGIATECGIARSRSPALVKEIIKIYAEVSREPLMQASA